MTKKMKRVLGISGASLASVVTIVPASLTLVACANEQDTTNSNASNANKPNNTKPNSPKPNPPTQSNPPIEPTCNLVFDSTKIKSIYNNINTQLNTIKKSADPLPQLTYQYLNNTASISKTTTQGFKTTVMTYIQKLMKTNDLSRAIKVATFDVDRYAEAVTFTINFYPKAFKGNPLSGNSHVKYGNNGKDKNTLVMTFSFPNIGLKTYVTYHVLEKMSLSMQQYVQTIYDTSITDMVYEILNEHASDMEPIMKSNGVNYQLVCRPTCSFGIPNVFTNSVVWNTSFHQEEDHVRYDPDCANGPDWEFDLQYGYFNPVWHGDLSTLFNHSRIRWIDIWIQREITKLAESGIKDIDTLNRQINTPAFSKKIWDIAFEKGFRFVDQGTKLIPRIQFYNLGFGQNKQHHDGFAYKYKFVLPTNTPMGKDLDINGWFNDTYCKLNLKDPNEIVIETQKQVVAPFVEDRPYQ